jgi:hypothetical protein
LSVRDAAALLGVSVQMARYAISRHGLKEVDGREVIERDALVGYSRSRTAMPPPFTAPAPPAGTTAPSARR